MPLGPGVRRVTFFKVRRLSFKFKFNFLGFDFGVDVTALPLKAFATGISARHVNFVHRFVIFQELFRKVVDELNQET